MSVSVRQGSRASSSLAGLAVSSSLDLEVDVIDDGFSVVMNVSDVDVELLPSVSSETEESTAKIEETSDTKMIRRRAATILLLFLPVVQVPDGAMCIS